MGVGLFLPSARSLRGLHLHSFDSGTSKGKTGYLSENSYLCYTFFNGLARALGMRQGEDIQTVKVMNNGNELGWGRTARKEKGKNCHERGELCGVERILINAFKQNSPI